MNVNLTPSLEQFVRNCAESGDYNNASEVVREAVRLLKRVEEQRALKLENLRRTIGEGDDVVAQGNIMDLGSDEDLDKFFTEPELDKSQIQATILQLKKHLRSMGVISMSLFGSVMRSEATSESDIDFLVDIDQNYHFSLVDLSSLKGLLEDSFGKSVDVVISTSLDPVIKDSVLSDAELLF